MRDAHIVAATFHDVFIELKKELLHEICILLEYIHTKSRFCRANDKAAGRHDVMKGHYVSLRHDVMTYRILMHT